MKNVTPSQSTAIRKINARTKREIKSGGDDSVAKKMISAAAGIVVTFAVGDLVLKRNFENYLKEKSELLGTIEKSIEEFDQLDREISQLMTERRGASLRLNTLSASKNIEGYLEYYQKYSDVVNKWNIESINIERKVNKITKCNASYRDYENLLEQKITSARENVNNSFSMRKITQSCPSFSLFFHRETPKILNSNYFYSANEVFYYMNDRFSSSLKRKGITCYKNAKSIVEKKISECEKSQNSLEIQKCLLGVDDNYSLELICDPKLFEPIANFLQVRFQSVDKFWDTAKNGFRIHKLRFVVERCESKKGFWANYLKWSCEQAVRKSL